MNNEKLKIAICGYLPYGVHIELEIMIGDPSESFELTLENIEGVLEYMRKPILFPISSLTKPIQLAEYNNGEPFVPIVEIGKQAKLYLADWDVSMIKHHFERWVSENTIDIHCPNWIIDLLNRWKIDYRGLINEGLAIEVNEENNPYL